MSEPYDYRAPASSQPGRPQGWSGTSRMPTQALGAQAPDHGRTSDYAPYPPEQRPRPGGPRRPRQGPKPRAKGVDYALKGLGLLGIAVVSGLLWFLIRNNPAPQHQADPPADPAPTGKYQFDPFQPASSVTDCAAHATGAVMNYLRGSPCTSLTRSLYTTSLDNGQKVATSVAVVQMDSQNTAEGLKSVSDKDESGHVKDLIEENIATIPGGPSSLQNAGYECSVKGDKVIIVMTEYADNSMDNTGYFNQDGHGDTLKGVSTDAINQNLGTSG